MTFTLTSSAISSYLTCQKKYFYRYREELVKVGESKRALSVGSAVHKGLEVMYDSEDIEPGVTAALKLLEESFKETFAGQKEIDEHSQNCRLVVELLRGYWKHHYDKSNFQTYLTETVFDLSVAGPFKYFVLKGKTDGLVQKHDGTWWIREFKTVTSVNSQYFYHKQIENQILNYIVATALTRDIVVSGMLYTYIKKPRPISEKGWADIASKITADNFVSAYIPVKLEQKSEQQDLIDQAFEEISGKAHSHEFMKNTNACFNFNAPCPYLDLCVSGKEFIGNYKKQNPFKELEDGN